MGRRLRPERPQEAGDQSGDPLPTTTKPIGRPTNYRPEYDQRVVDLGAQGYSIAEIIADIAAGSYETIDRWKKTRRSFYEAMIRARQLSLAWWERTGRENAGNRDFNSNLYRIIMMARFGADGYRERAIVEHVEGEAGLDLGKLEPAQREVLAQLLEAAKIQPSQDLPKPASEPAEPVKMADLSGSVH